MDEKNNYNGLWFNKWVLTDFGSGAVKGIINGKNVVQDIIAIRQNQAPLLVTSQQPELYQNYLQSVINNLLVKNFIEVKLKNEKATLTNLNLNDLTIADFNFTISSKAFLQNLQINEIKSVNLDTNQIVFVGQVTTNNSNLNKQKTYNIEIVWTNKK
ncbi:hypothetical protein [Mycoplasmopsis gallopavonis]|uniref:Uncharacterized protein n=1 Tax=Mycoplasmopsis gallopavonis TaxID=76629 RepID=A0A449AZ45_9BACT|nr:hypothetical protein [Mycoplasmopsis gallopavonis]RIV16279.1 hypothetical protein D1113_02975 [Mycoplasmopsis gallopavonis]VEU72757.1 Uncharacterised protein [Mycoplasmopsis gallopavonis]